MGIRTCTTVFFFFLLLIQSTSVWAFHDPYEDFDNFGVSYSQSLVPPSIISIDMNPQNHLNYALRQAAKLGRLADLALLLQEGAELNAKSDTGQTALMGATRSCAIHSVDFLVSKGANTNLQDAEGETALMIAVENSCAKVVKSLLNVPGMQFSTRDHLGKTVFDYAQENLVAEVDGPASEIVRLLHNAYRKSRVSANRSRFKQSS